MPPLLLADPLLALPVTLPLVAACSDCESPEPPIHGLMWLRETCSGRDIRYSEECSSDGILTNERGPVLSEVPPLEDEDESGNEAGGAGERHIELGRQRAEEERRVHGVDRHCPSGGPEESWAREIRGFSKEFSFSATFAGVSWWLVGKFVV